MTRGGYRDWEKDALCKEVGPIIFYPEVGCNDLFPEARKVCGMCSVREQCLEVALAEEEEFGIWGGLSPRQRLGVLRSMHGPDYTWPRFTDGLDDEPIEGMCRARLHPVGRWGDGRCTECHKLWNRQDRARKRAAERVV